MGVLKCVCIYVYILIYFFTFTEFCTVLTQYDVIQGGLPGKNMPNYTLIEISALSLRQR